MRHTTSRFQAYLPAALIRLPVSNVRTGPSRTHVDAALLLCDIAGFTALTERLQARGREGAEEVARIVDRAFRPAIDAVERHGGAIASFGGDSIFAVFPSPRAVPRARAAGREIRRSFRRAGQSRKTRVQLSGTLVLHAGLVTLLHLEHHTRRHLAVTGRSVMELARMLAAARRGSFTESPSLSGFREKARPAGSLEGMPIDAYVPRGLERVWGSGYGAFRYAAVMFIECRGHRPLYVQRLYAALDEILVKFEGVLLKTDLSEAGLKWLCVFGVPAAHEDDAPRAALAARELLARTPMPVRLGLHVGTVASVEFGTKSRRGFDVMGDVVNTAARAMGRAHWREALVTEETVALLGGLPTLSRGLHVVKGKSRPIELHALAEAPGHEEQDSVGAPFVGRQRELSQVTSAMDRAIEGEGAAIGLRGDAGIGKSRMAWEVMQLAQARGMDVHRARAVRFGEEAHRLTRHLVASLLGLDHAADEIQTLSAVKDAVSELGLDDVDGDHLAYLLGRALPREAAEDERRVRLNACVAVRRLVRARARQRPLCLVLDDLHWADGQSVEIVAFVSRGLQGVPVLLLACYRPTFEASVASTEILLDELAPEAVRSLLDALLGEGAAGALESLVRRTGGNPLYVEELTRRLVEVGALQRSEEGFVLTREPTAEDVPPSLDTMVGARLDGLSREALDLAQLVSVVGMRAHRNLVSSLTPGQLDVARASAELAQSGILEVERDHLSMRHAVVRDVCYGRLLVAKRRELHRAVVKQLEKRKDRADDAVLAHHWDQAGDAARASGHYLAAGRAARDRFAPAEAESAYRRYLALAPRAGQKRIQARAELAKILARGGRNAEAMRFLAGCRREASRLPGHPLLGQILRQMGAIHRDAGRYATARRLLARSLGLEANAAGRIDGLDAMAVMLVKTHRHDRALQCLRDAIAIAHSSGHWKREAMLKAQVGSVHLERGELPEAERLYRGALRQIRRAGDRGYEGVILGNLAVVYALRKDYPQSRELQEQALRLRRQVGDRVNVGIALANLGGIHHLMGEHERARQAYEQALAIHRETENIVGEGQVLGNLARLNAENEDPQRVLDLLEQAIVVQRRAEDLMGEGQCREDIGQTLRRLGRDDEARLAFVEAIDLLRRVGNKVALADALVAAGDLERDTGHLELARERWREAWRCAKAIGHQEAIAACHERLGLPV